MTNLQVSEQSQDTQRQQKSLDSRYGKIGISAVAAALHHCAARPAAATRQRAPYESD